MNSDLLIHDLNRLINYGPIDETARQLLRNVIETIRTPDDVLDESVPHLNSLANLLEVVVDARKFAKAVGQLRALVDEANAARAAANMATAELDTKAAELEPKLAAAKQEHAAQIALERDAFDKRVADYQRQLSVREAAVADLEKAAKANFEASEKMKADMSARLDRMRAAAA